MRVLERKSREAATSWATRTWSNRHSAARPASARLAAAWRWCALPVGVALSVRIVLFALGYIAAALLGRAKALGPLVIWAQWDASSYLRVASGGYRYSHVTGSLVNSFPLYPLLIRYTEPFARIVAPRSSYLLAGIVVSWLAFALACALLYHLTLERFDHATAMSAVVLLSVFPFSFYFGAIFTESLYLLLAVLAFYAVQHRNWWLAGAAALLAGAERPPGLLVGACVLLAYALDWLRTRHPLRPDALALVLTPLGAAAYFAYLWWRFGDPLAYIHSSQIGWHGGRLQSGGLLRAWNVLTHLPADITSGRYLSVLDGIYVIVLVAVLVAAVPIWRLLGATYAVYTVASVLLPVSTYPGVNSMGRYASVAFPVFMLLAVWLRGHETGRALATSASAVALGLFVALFVSGYPLA